MSELRTGEAAIIEIHARARTGDNPTAGNIDVAIRFFKVGHANHLKFWDGDSWEAGPVYVTSTQKDFHAHEVSLAATALVAGMERGIITVRAASTLDIGGEARFDVVPAAWLDDAVYVSDDGDTIANGADGSRGNPVSTIADMDTLAAANGIRRVIFLSGSFTLIQTYERWVFEGETFATIDMNGQTLSGTIFKQLVLTGSGNPAACFECGISNATYKGTYCFRTVILGAVTLGDGTNPLYLMDCASYGATITLTNNVHTAKLGGTGTFAGLTTGTVNLTELEGVFTIDNTCTGGTINITGIIDLTDNSGAGCTVNLTDGALSLTGINNGGPGLYQVTIHVQDGVAAPISEVKVHVFDSTNASPRWFGETDTSGDATFNLGAGTFSVRLAKGTTGFTVPESIVVTQDETFTLVGTPFVAPTAVDPGDCAVYGTIWDSEGNPWAGVQIDVRATIDPQFVGDITMGDRLGTTRTSALGEFTIDLLKEAEVRFIVADAGIDFTKTVPDAANVNIKDWT